MNDHIQIRSRKFETAIQNLEKFNGEYGDLANYLDKAQQLIDALENVYARNADNYDKLKSTESEARTLETDLLARHADLRFMKISYQNFSNLTDSFSRDLHNYCAKLKESHRVKRLSSDLQSDLSYLKECLSDADAKYKLLCSRLKSLKETLYNLMEHQKLLTTSCAKLDSWLTEIELKVSTDVAELNDLMGNRKSAPNQQNQVRALDELNSKFQAYKIDIQLQAKLVDEIQKNLQTLLGKQLKNVDQDCKDTFTGSVGKLVTRYKSVEGLIDEKHDYLISSLTKARNLKENIDSTNSWLNQINLASLASPNEMDKLKSELDSRKDALVNSIPPSDFSTNKMVDQLLEKIEFINANIDAKASKAKMLESFLDSLSENYDKISHTCKSCSHKLETSDALKDYKKLHLKSFLNNIQFIEGMYFFSIQTTKKF